MLSETINSALQFSFSLKTTQNKKYVSEASDNRENVFSEYETMRESMTYKEFL